MSKLFSTICYGKDCFCIGDIVKFIIRYRRSSGAFNLWSIGQLVSVIQRSYEDNTLAISYSSKGIDGIAIAQLKSNDNIHVLGILATRPKVINQLYHIFWLLWGMKGYSLTAMRRGKMVVYDTSKLAYKLVY